MRRKLRPLPGGVEMFDPTVQISLFRKLKRANRVTFPAIAKTGARLPPLRSGGSVWLDPITAVIC
jgi:hypothetical protein